MTAGEPAKRNASPSWDWITDMRVTTNPPLPGLGGTDNPGHLQKIEIRVVSKTGIKIERAKFGFNATGWDQKTTQSGAFYMNRTSDTNWYVILGISYFYTQPWDGKEMEDAYDSRLLVTAGTTVKWNVSVYNQGQSPAEISSPPYSYTVEGSWYRVGNTDPEIFRNNIRVTISPAKPMIYDKVTIKLTVKDPPPGRTVKPKIYTVRVHLTLYFNDIYRNNTPEMQFDGVPGIPVLSYNKTVTISKDWHYKPGITAVFWAECWLEASKRYYHITSTPSGVWNYTVSEAGMWKKPPPNGTFAQNIEISAEPDVLHNPNAAITPGQPGCGNVTVTVRSLFPDVPLHPAARDLAHPGNYFPGTMLWYTAVYDDGSSLVNETGVMTYFPAFPVMERSNSTCMMMVIPSMGARYAKGEVRFYAEVWNLTKKIEGRLFSDADPLTPDTVGPDDPYRYNLAEMILEPRNKTSFVVWVYDNGLDMKYVPGVEVTFKNGTNLGVPISRTATNSMGWCCPAAAGGDLLLLWVGDTVLVEINYYMPPGAGTGRTEQIRANYTYKISIGKSFGNTTIMREYSSPYRHTERYIYYIVVSELPGAAANIFFKFNWKPPKPSLVYAGVQPFSSEILATSLGTGSMMITLVPAVLILDRRRKKADEDEKRVTL